MQVQNMQRQYAPLWCILDDCINEKCLKNKIPPPPNMQKQKGSIIMAMSKKCYAAIMSARETTTEIKKLTDEVKATGVKNAYKNLMKIAELNDKFYRDFHDVDPAWSIDKKNQGQQVTVPISADGNI